MPSQYNIDFVVWWAPLVLLIIWSRNEGFDNQVDIREICDGMVERTFTVFKCCCSDCSLLLSSQNDKHIYWHSISRQSVVFSPKGKTFVSWLTVIHELFSNKPADSLGTNLRKTLWRPWSMKYLHLQGAKNKANNSILKECTQERCWRQISWVSFYAGQVWTVPYLLLKMYLSLMAPDESKVSDC